MNRKNLCVFLLTMTNFMKQVSADSRQSKKDRIDRLVHELGERVKAREKHSGNEETLPDSIITCYEKDIDPKTIFGMYQSLCNKTAHEDEATMITVSFCSEGNDENSKNKLMANFMYALQSQINSNRNYTRKDGLYLTLDHISYADIEHLDLLNSHDIQMRSIYKKFDVTFIRNLEEIAYLYLEREMMREFEAILCERINEYSKDLTQKNGSIGKEADYERIVELLTKSSYSSFSNFNSDCILLNDYAEKMIGEIFTNDDRFSIEEDDIKSALMKYFRYVADKKYKETLVRCLNDLAKFCLELIKENEAKEAFSIFYSCLIDEVSGKIELQQNEIASSIASHSDCDESEGLYSSDESDYYETESSSDFREYVKSQAFKVKLYTLIQKPYQIFFRNLYNGTNTKKFCKMNEKQRDKILDKLKSEKELKIVIDGVVTPDNIYELVRIVNDGKILEDSCDGQIMFIVPGKEINHTIIIRKDAKRKNLDTIKLLNSITLKVLSKSMLTNDNSSDSANHLAKFKLQVTKGAKDGCTMYQEAAKAPNENLHVVSLSEGHIPHEMSDDSVNYLMTRCQENGGQIKTHNIVSAVNDTESVNIHILYQVRSDQYKTEVVSIIYNPQLIFRKHDLRYFTTLEASTICLFNVPTTILDDLDHSLMCLLVQDTKFNIPNLLTLQNRDLVYTEKIIDIGSNAPFAFLLNNPEENNGCDGFRKISFSFSYEEIAHHIDTKHGRKSYTIDYFAEKMGIQIDDFNDILHQVIFNGRSLDTDADCPLEVDRVSTGFEVVVYVTQHDDNSRVLNICQTEENIYGDKISISPYSIFRKLLENEDFCPIMQNMSYEMEPSVPKEAFTKAVFNKIYDSICCDNFFLTFFNNVEKAKKEYTKDIIERIQSVINQNQKGFAIRCTCSQAYYAQFQQFLLKLAVPEKIEPVVETMIKEMLKLKLQRTMKITSIFLSRPDDNTMCHKLKRFSENHDDKFVNVDHLTCQDCQSLQGCQTCQECKERQKK